MRPQYYREGSVCRSRTRESLESMGERVPVRPKSYDFGYRFRRQQSLNPDRINPSQTLSPPPAELEYVGMRLEGAFFLKDTAQGHEVPAWGVRKRTRYRKDKS